LINKGKATKPPSFSVLDKNVEVVKKKKQNSKMQSYLRAGFDRKISSTSTGVLSKMCKTLHRFIASAATIILDTHYF